MKYILMASLFLLLGCNDTKNEKKTAPIIPPAKEGLTCLYYGSSILAAQTVTGYLTSAVPYGQICQRLTASCDGQTGQLTAMPVPYCTVLPPKNCTYYGSVYIVGSTITGYAKANVPFGSQCELVTSVCNGGTGTFDPIPELTCTVLPPKVCSFQGQSLIAEEQVSGYTSSTVPFGQTCTPVVGTCSGATGLVSPLPASLSCSVTPPLNCVLDGQTVLHGASVVAYSVASAGDTFCSENQQQRTCNNGVLSGESTYKHISCSEKPMVLKIYAHSGKKHIIGISKKLNQTTNLPRIDWGDGNFSNVNVVTSIINLPSHYYSFDGEVQVRILGEWKRDILDKPFFISPEEEPSLEITAPLVGANISGESYQGILLELIDWGDNVIDTFNALFTYQTKLTSLPTQPPNLSLATDMSLMFFGTYEFNQDLNAWNTANITNMKGVFWHATKFNQPLSWDTSKVTNMEAMFSNTSEFNQPLNFNTSQVSNMTRMFNASVKFNQDLSDFCVPLILTKPSGFDNLAINWLEIFKPRWGMCN